MVSFINMKGGVGKTTLAVNVAYGLAFFHKKNVLIVDGDPQFNATQYLLTDDAYLRHTRDSKKGTIKDIFVPAPAAPVRTVGRQLKGLSKAKMPLSSCALPIWHKAGAGKLDLIPSTIALMEIETSRRGTETKLKTYLNEKAQAYDYVIIDCPPTISIFTQAAILASDSYLVPIKPDPLSVIGLPLLERWLAECAEDSGIELESLGLVFTLVRGNPPAAMQDVMDDLRDRREDDVFQTHLNVSTDVAESVDAHLPVFRHKPSSKTAKQVIEITEEFFERTTGE